GNLLARTRRRALLDALAQLLPVPLALAALLWRWPGCWAAAAATAGLVAAIAVALRRRRRFDRHWLVQQLDAARSDLDDSSGLLLADDAALSPLQRLQRDRLEQRLRDRPAPDLRPSWSTRTIVPAWLALAATCLAVALWPAARRAIDAAPPAASAAVAVEAPQLLSQSLQ